MEPILIIPGVISQVEEQVPSPGIQDVIDTRAPVIPFHLFAVLPHIRQQLHQSGSEEQHCPAGYSTATTAHFTYRETGILLDFCKFKSISRL